jgi:hypothetical protein
MSEIEGATIWICESSLIIDANMSRVFESEPFMTGLNDLILLYSTSSLIERI